MSTSAFESLGRSAAKCESDATLFAPGTWESDRLLHQAEQFRCAQLELLADDAPQIESVNAFIELIYAGNALADEKLRRTEGGAVTCTCGALTQTPEDPAFHYGQCKVARFFAAVEAVRKAAL